MAQILKSEEEKAKTRSDERAAKKRRNTTPGEKERGRGAVFVGVFSGRSAASAHRESGAVESRRIKNRSRIGLIERTRRQNCKRRTRNPRSRKAASWKTERGRKCAAELLREGGVWETRVYDSDLNARRTIQLYCDESRIDPEQFETIKTLVDVGDIVGCEGPLKRTDKGELSIVVEDIKVLTKSLRNLPDKWHGLQDVEIKYRQRYVDLIASSESRDTFYQRAQIIKTMRRYLEDELEFMEWKRQ